MKIIDSHHHAWKYDPVNYGWINDEMSVLKKDFLADDLHTVFDKYKVVGSVLVQAVQSDSETEFCLQLAEKSNIIKGVVGWVDLQSEDLEEKLDMYKNFPKLKGFRHVVQSEPDPNFMLGENFQRGIAALHHFNFTYDILIYPTQLPAAIELARRFPEQSFVLDHIAKPYIRDKKISIWSEQIKILANQDNVYCKVSGMVTEADWEGWVYDDFVPYLDLIVEAFGNDRIMFGSDFPVCLLAGSYDSVLGLAERYFEKFTIEDRHKIFYENATRFYNLDHT